MFSRIASTAIAPPSISEPVSPMKILAGAVFHHRKPAHAPNKAGGDDREIERVRAGRTEVVEDGWRNCQNPITTNAPRTWAAEPTASPSSPSVRFTPFDEAAIIRNDPDVEERAEVERRRSEERKVGSDIDDLDGDEA